MKKEPDLQQAERVAYLLAGHIRQSLTGAEQEELDTWKQESERNQQLFTELTDTANLNQALNNYNAVDIEDRLQKSKEGLRFRQPSRMKQLRPFLVAASLIGIAVLVYLLQPASVKKQDDIVRAIPGDILPGNAQAMLRLADGTHIDIVKADSIVTTGVTKKEDELIYTQSTAPGTYHELLIPRKGFYKLRLADGTTVTLNADSRLRYPSSFSGNERKVFLEGEAYFEVAHDAARPFLVETNTLSIRDIGTAFTVTAYPEESAPSAFLEEGAIAVTAYNRTVQLKPGEQLKGDSSLAISDAGNPQALTAWTRNQFRFVNTPIQTIMRQVARWYDADIIYENNLSVHLTATIDRNTPVSRLLKLLEKTNDVHFTVEGKRITVKK